MKNLILIVFLFQSVCGFSQTNIFIATDGNNSSGDGSITNPYKTIMKGCDVSSPGDTIQVRGGTYKNSDYGNGNIWNGTYVARIAINGTAENYITIQQYDSEEVIIKFDGVYGFLLQQSSYVRIKGLIFEGVADEISQQQAEDAWGFYKDENQVVHDLEAEMGIDITDLSLIGISMDKPTTSNVDKPFLYNGRALVANRSHHIEFLENTIRNVPSAAIRAQKCDYITISRNTIYNNTYWTTQGVGAITISEATVTPEGDTFTGVKIIISENTVYGNENRLISWNPSKTFIHFEIDEGTGIFLTRNNNTYTHGKMLIANNLSYRNGASGIVCHHTDDVVIDHNTVFDNGTTNHGLPGGIGVNASDNVKILSNISYSKTNKWGMGILAEPVTNLVLDANIVFNNSGSIDIIRDKPENPISSGFTEIDPIFSDALNNDFKLMSTSSAIDNASSMSSQTTDYFGKTRDDSPDIGAIEYGVFSTERQDATSVVIFPNPANEIIQIKGTSIEKASISIYDIRGRLHTNFKRLGANKIDISSLASGLYFLKLNSFVYKVFKN